MIKTSGRGLTCMLFDIISINFLYYCLNVTSLFLFDVSAFHVD